ncbi:UNVERIFIED_CONTAM: hypothetical protein K2H54_064068 [Gekko kuhli]
MSPGSIHWGWGKRGTEAISNDTPEETEIHPTGRGGRQKTQENHWPPPPPPPPCKGIILFREKDVAFWKLNVSFPGDFWKLNVSFPGNAPMVFLGFLVIL